MKRFKEKSNLKILRFYTITAICKRCRQNLADLVAQSEIIPPVHVQQPAPQEESAELSPENADQPAEQEPIPENPDQPAARVEEVSHLCKCIIYFGCEI